MNAIPPRLATPEEKEQAAEVIIPAAELQRLYAEAKARRAREDRSRRRATRARYALIAGLTAAVIAEGAAIATMMPLVRIVPVFTPVRGSDGTVGPSTALWDSLPEKDRETNILTTLWNYVECRESWSSATAEKCWTIVSALSTRDVREQFQQWYGKDNPESPARVYGDRATVRLVFRSVDKLPGGEGAYQFRFDRIEHVGGQDKPPVSYVAPIRFRRLDNPDKLPWWQRVTFNAPALQVFEYRGATQEGVTIR